MSDVEEVYSMGYAEYLFRMEMENRRRKFELENKLHEIWLAERVTNATNEKGEFVYKTFGDFLKIINEEKKEVKGDFDELRRVAMIQRKMRKGGN